MGAVGGWGGGVEGEEEGVLSVIEATDDVPGAPIISYRVSVVQDRPVSVGPLCCTCLHHAVQAVPWVGTELIDCSVS